MLTHINQGGVDAIPERISRCRSRNGTVGVGRIVIGSDYNMDAGYSRLVEFDLPRLVELEFHFPDDLLDFLCRGADVRIVLGGAVRRYGNPRLEQAVLCLGEKRFS